MSSPQERKRKRSKPGRDDALSDNELQSKSEAQAVLDAYGKQFMSLFPAESSASAALAASKAERKKSKKLARLMASSTEVAAGEAPGTDLQSIFHNNSKKSGTVLNKTQKVEPVSTAETIVFQSPDAESSQSQHQSKASFKKFMSAKINRLTTSEDPSEANKRKMDADGEDDETNIANDKALHKLIHTELIPTLTAHLQSGAQRQHSLAGRVAEVSSYAVLGKGESKVRETERKMASKSVREGIKAKQQQLAAKAKEESKNIGNYHPSLKALFEDGTKTGRDDRAFGGGGSSSGRDKRQKGLSMGVGTFKRGMLVLSKSEFEHGKGTSRGLAEKDFSTKFKGPKTRGGKR